MTNKSKNRNRIFMESHKVKYQAYICAKWNANPYLCINDKTILPTNIYNQNEIIPFTDVKFLSLCVACACVPLETLCQILCEFQTCHMLKKNKSSV